jgi:hypothetical protein
LVVTHEPISLSSRSASPIFAPSNNNNAIATAGAGGATLCGQVAYERSVAMRKHSVQIAGSAILASVAAFIAPAPPAWAEISGGLNLWTVTAKIEQLEDGSVQASARYDDNGWGGTRSGFGFSMVTNLGLGQCETQDECSARAVERGYPGPTNGPPGWFHYCVAAATDEGVPHKKKSCWSRPGSPFVYGFVPPPPPAPGSAAVPGTVISRQASPYGIPAGGFDSNGNVVGHPERPLENEKREWTVLACLGSGGTGSNGLPVGVQGACRNQIQGQYIYVIDTPIEVKKGP